MMPVWYSLPVMSNNTKRKRGRPAGSTSFVRVRMADLIDHLGSSSSSVIVSKKWLTEVGLEVKTVPLKVIPKVPSVEKEENKIQFNIE